MLHQPDQTNRLSPPTFRYPPANTFQYPLIPISRLPPDPQHAVVESDGLILMDRLGFILGVQIGVLFDDRLALLSVRRVRHELRLNVANL